MTNTDGNLHSIDLIFKSLLCLVLYTQSILLDYFVLFKSPHVCIFTEQFLSESMNLYIIYLITKS